MSRLASRHPVPASSSRSRGRGSTAWAAVVLAALLTLAAPAAPASAHDALSGSSPADGTTVDVAPASVDLTFTRPPLAVGAEVRVTGPDGQVVNDGDPVLVDTTVSQPVAPDLPAGQYAVAWRVTSADGHPISGELTFTAAAAPEAEQPSPTPTPTSDDGAPTPEATPTEAPPADTGGTETDAAGASTGTGSLGALPWALGGLLVVAGAAAALWAAWRRSAGGELGGGGVGGGGSPSGPVDH
jgi:copper resistance protein C